MGSRRARVRFGAGLCALVMGSALLSCVRDPAPDGKIHLTYWEKWVRFEGRAMQLVVDAFNASQDRIVVHMETFGPVDRKTLLAAAGGNPPDLVGMWAPQVASHADHNALTPLDAYMARDGITRDHWLPVYVDLCTLRGRMWAVPTTPTTLALHWNKAMFRAAGLDPDRPPRTLAELDDFARKLTRYDAAGNITQMGFLPWEPDWYIWGIGPWFGGQLFDGLYVSANHPLNVEAFDWLQSYPRTYGAAKIKRFTSGFGSFASPQNAFFSGKVAMIFHGVWLHNYITQFAPGMEYGVAPYPRTPHGPAGFSIADMDVLVIPAGVPGDRRDAAWEFLRYVSSQPAMETLNTLQRKTTPLTQVSEAFLQHHPHPYIRVFDELSRSPNIVHLPQMGIWVRYEAELRAAAERLWLMETNPATRRPYTAREVLDEVQTHMGQAWERHCQSRARHELTLRETP